MMRFERGTGSLADDSPLGQLGGSGSSGYGFGVQGLGFRG